MAVKRLKPGAAVPCRPACRALAETSGALHCSTHLERAAACVHTSDTRSELRFWSITTNLPNNRTPQQLILQLHLDSEEFTMSGSGTKAVIKNADMSEEMQADAIDCATTVRI